MSKKGGRLEGGGRRWGPRLYFNGERCGLHLTVRY